MITDCTIQKEFIPSIEATIGRVPTDLFLGGSGDGLMERLVDTTRAAFGRPDMDYEDIRSHVMSPQLLYTLEDGDTRTHPGEVFGFGGYNLATLAGEPTLIVHGIAIDPVMQRRGVFKAMTDLARIDASGQGAAPSLLGLRTQNPHMYRALEGYCSQTYPAVDPTQHESRRIQDLRLALARELNCTADGQGVVHDYFGSLFYGAKPVHSRITPLFERLGMKLEQGDALLVLGQR